MNNNNFKFYIALITILIYEIVMIIFHLDGFSLSKLGITLLIWIAFFVFLRLFIEQFSVLKRTIPTIAFIVLLLLLAWNVIGILRSTFRIEDQLTTIYGSIFHVLALLVPFVIIYSAREFNLNLLHSYFMKLLKVGILLFVVFLSISGINFHQIQSSLLFLFLTPAVFLITVLPFETKKNRLIVLFCVPLLFYAAYLLSIRTMMIREVLLFMCLTGVYLYSKLHFKFILRLSFLFLLIPLILFQYSVETGESAIQKVGLQDSESDLSTDTRTFLYKEVFNDLIFTDQLIVGKGANGRYYSEFFTVDLGIVADRESVEVGILAILLKGGLIAVILNLVILFLAIYYAFFKSNNTYVIGVGFMLLVYTMLLFIENILNYSSYNLWLWFFIGICLSKRIRAMNNKEIFLLLRTKMKYK